MRQSYGNLLGLLSKLPPAAYQKPTNTTIPQPIYVSEDIVVYSTRYRRTFQSAMALMFAFLPPERWLALTIREAHSVAFCFTDCACPQAIYLKNELQKEAHQLLLKNHASVASKIKTVGMALLQYPSLPLHPMDVRDAILSMMCHNAELPCRRPGEDDVMAGVVEQPASSTSEANDFINIDQDQDFSMGAGSKCSLKKIYIFCYYHYHSQKMHWTCSRSLRIPVQNRVRKWNHPRHLATVAYHQITFRL